MTDIKKFNKKSYLEHLSKTVKEMDAEDAYIMAKGVYTLWENLNKYYRDKYGSHKRIEDMYEYISTIQSSYLNRTKKEKSTPY